MWDVWQYVAKRILKSGYSMNKIVSLPRLIPKCCKFRLLNVHLHDNSKMHSNMSWVKQVFIKKIYILRLGSLHIKNIPAL